MATQCSCGAQTFEPHKEGCALRLEYKAKLESFGLGGIPPLPKTPLKCICGEVWIEGGHRCRHNPLGKDPRGLLGYVHRVSDAPQPQVAVGRVSEVRKDQPVRVYGWACPLCSRIHAPWLETCGCTAISLGGAIA